MRFSRKAKGTPNRLAILSAAFHPPTRAHFALVEAALGQNHADEGLLVLPERFPHKQYERVPLEQRLALLTAAAEAHPGLSIAVANGGLFREIAAEAQLAYGPATRLRFLCGRDAAERIVAWDYGDGPDIEEQLREFDLLVAPRGGVYTPPVALAERIIPLELSQEWDGVSSTQVRERIRQRAPWRHLIPDPIADAVEQLYS